MVHALTTVGDEKVWKESGRESREIFADVFRVQVVKHNTSVLNSLHSTAKAQGTIVQR